MKNYTYLLGFLFVSNIGFSQVKDISFTVSPFAEYTFWDNKAGLEDGALVGGKLGFGFGEYIELRAVYLQSLDMKTRFSNYGFNGYNDNLFSAQKINLTRWGGEIKANIGSGKLNPYLTLGSGIQNLEIDGGEDFDQIYTNFGLGIKTKFTDRIVLNLEAKNALYNFNSGKTLLSNDDKTEFGVTDADFDKQLLSNWSVSASLQFYLGGRKPGSLTALDKAYLQKFKGGFKGLQWVVEPSLNYIKFDDNSNFRNTYLMGAYAGLDFNEYIGVRGFLFRPSTDDEISTTLDRFSMYGLEFRARLNDGNGVTPYLILGGGYLNTLSGYEGKNGFNFDSQEFASAGLGLNIPISKNILITGGARGMITSGSNVEDLASPDELQTHIMYNAGIKLIFGNKSVKPSSVYNNQLDDALDQQDKITQEIYNEKAAAQKQKNENKLALLKEEYQSRLDSLQTQLEIATLEKNTDKAVEVLEQKKETQKALKEIDVVSKQLAQKPVEAVAKEMQVKKEAAKKVETEAKKVDTTNVALAKVQEVKEKVVKVDEVIVEDKVQVAKSPNQPKELIKMTPAELEMLIDKILEKTDNTQNVKKTVTPTTKKPESNSEINDLKKRIETLEKLLIDQNKVSNGKKNETSKVNDEMALQLEELKLQNELNAKNIDVNKANANKNKFVTDKTFIVNSPAGTLEDTKVKDEIEEAIIVSDSIIENSEEVLVEERVVVEGRFIKEERVSNFSEKLSYRGTSAYAGMNFGGQSAPVVGVRFNYGLPNTKLELMPEFYYGIANPSAFGLSVNLMYPFKALSISEFMTPYVGIGAGLTKNDGDFYGNHNIIVGTNLNIGKGRIFVDFTARNFAKNNQVALGYRFNF